MGTYHVGGLVRDSGLFDLDHLKTTSVSISHINYRQL